MQFVNKRFPPTDEMPAYTFENNWFPSLYAMQKAGIEFVIFDQNPSDIVMAGPGVFHWVISPVSLIVC
jgi:hypothetical protein